MPWVLGGGFLRELSRVPGIPVATMAVGTVGIWWLWRARRDQVTGTRNPTGLSRATAAEVPWDSRVDDAGPEYDQRPARHH